MVCGILMNHSNQFTNQSGHLDVGDGHSIYWEDWGNPKVQEPVLFFHGGPGSGCKEKHKWSFDPEKHRVIFHDQRGCGRSTPYGKLESNTTQHLIGDILQIAKKCNVERFALFGRSWGSALALCFAIHHPEMITKMLLGGIFLIRKEDIEFVETGKVATHFPEVWEEYQSSVPKENKAQPSAYHLEKMKTGTAEERRKSAEAFIRYEASLLSMDYLPESISFQNAEDDRLITSALLESHYLTNNCFVEDNYILKNIEKIQNIETTIIQGRYDFICPPNQAYQLHKAMKNSTLRIVAGAHSSSDETQRELLRNSIQGMFG